MQNHHLIKEIIFWGVFIYLALKWGQISTMYQIKVSTWQKIKMINDATWSEKDKKAKEKILGKIENKQWVEKTIFCFYLFLFWTVRWLFFYILN